MKEQVIGHARCVDGTTRTVYLDGEWQYVLDEGNESMGCSWFRR